MKTLKMLAIFALLTTLFANATPEPWYKDPQGTQLDWKPFEALPKLEEPHSNWARYWKIEERGGTVSPKFFAISYKTSSGSQRKFLMADASTTPNFIEVNINLDQLSYICDTAMCTWEKPDEEFFAGTSTGLWRFDEDLGNFVSEWYWHWDATYRIIPLGNAIYGAVGSWGSLSGYHLWKPDGTDVYDRKSTRNLEIWGDPISGKYGVGARRYVRIVPSGNKSIMIDSFGHKGRYSVNGGKKFHSPVGVRKDKKPMSNIDSFYCYTDNTVIIKSYYGGDAINIGTLGGYLYQMSPPSKWINTFFYSPSTRLIIAGSSTNDDLYSAVLPAPNEIWFPDLQFRQTPTSTVLYWISKQNPLKLEVSADQVNWQKVTTKQVTSHGTTKVVVPSSTVQMYYRLNYP